MTTKPLASSRSNRPDTYQRLPKPTHDLYCETQPVHTLGQIPSWLIERSTSASSSKAANAPCLGQTRGLRGMSVECHKPT